MFPGFVIPSAGQTNPLSLNVNTTDSAVLVSSVTETTLYTYTVPANTLKTGNILRVNYFMEYLNNSGAPETVTVRFKYGGTTIATLAPSITANATRRYLAGEFWLEADAATNAQRGLAWMTANLLNGSNSVNQSGDDGTGGEDDTTALAVAITVQHTTNAATISAQMRWAMTELLTVV